MNQNFATIFDDVRHERNFKVLLNLVEPVILRQSKFTDHEISIVKDLALEKVHRQRVLKEEVAFALLESGLEVFFLLNK